MVSAGPWSTADYTSAFTGTPAASNPVLTAIRVGAHPEDGYDRIALDFNQPQAPGFTVKYVDQVVMDGSGQPVTQPGSAFPQIVFQPADAHDVAGNRASAVPTGVKATGFTGLQSYVVNGDFEGYVSVALGQSSKAGFKVTKIHQTNGNWTIAVDVPRP
jgi:hypothetical protein